MSSIIQSTFIQHAFCLNRWVWFHMVAFGGLLTRILLLFGIASFSILMWVAVFAIAWEILELAFELKFKKENIIKTYGRVLYYLYDCIGDILGAVIISMLILM